MPLFFLLIGMLFVVTGVNNTTKEMFALVKAETPGFLPWIASIFVLGALGYVQGIKPVANMLLLLLVIVLLLVAQKQDGSGGFFAKMTDAIKGAETSTGTTATSGSSSGGGGGLNVSNILGSAKGLFSGLGNLFKTGGSGMDAATFDI